MDLYTGKPIWLACPREREPISTTPLEADVRCDVAVIGGGITGALLCDRLVRAGVDTVVLDSRDFGSASTAASTGLLMAETDTPLVELVRRFGEEAAGRILGLGIEAVMRLLEMQRDVGEDAALMPRSSLIVASSREDAQELEGEIEVRRRLGHPAERLTSGDLRERGFSISAPLAMRTEIAGEVNAHALSRALVRRSVERGVRAYCPVRVVAREPDSNGGVRLRTSAGPSVTARAAILATGYEAHEQLRTDIGTLHSTWVIASDELAAFPGWPEKTLIWETARPYLYARTAGNRIVVGGLDEPHEEAHQSEEKVLAKAREIAKRLSGMFPEIEMKVVTAWGGTFGESRDGLPYIGRVGGASGEAPIYAALGYGGNGITFAMIAAGMLGDAVRGVENPDAHLFRFGR